MSEAVKSPDMGSYGKEVCLMMLREDVTSDDINKFLFSKFETDPEGVIDDCVAMIAVSGLCMSFLVSVINSASDKNILDKIVASCTDRLPVCDANNRRDLVFLIEWAKARCDELILPVELESLGTAFRLTSSGDCPNLAVIRHIRDRIGEVRVETDGVRSRQDSLLRAYQDDELGSEQQRLDNLAMEDPLAAMRAYRQLVRPGAPLANFYRTGLVVPNCLVRSE
ncbi:MAG: hypothetical protein ACD_51C00231G0010 [uncultured bacterium]|nr:MAG: hypothetical protein ACD_51C00231G0010 [uncultured bacterium]OGJ48591.1 MAG: hypothetical protein A2344_04800 [Candidatus Peregrinibacteria bacterium RIFOXYB12_FULL_41_12]OGJ48682.1 MAG: hypothetical protein A2244_03225 [Candidatus Peregrinibacteria bacterium RIFOXYA2_FULL_41_18]OGJ54514.1 MAG: hypothetical protein A2336_04480 [Candidatus Peregrinibacteria bacterium RIFOXYB2_FULL_41_88]